MKTLESLVRKSVEGHPQDRAKALEELDLANAWIFVWYRLSLACEHGSGRLVWCGNTYHPESA